jgi:hypothetical protein
MRLADHGSFIYFAIVLALCTADARATAQEGDTLPRAQTWKEQALATLGVRPFDPTVGSTGHSPAAANIEVSPSNTRTRSWQFQWPTGVGSDRMAPRGWFERVDPEIARLSLPRIQTSSNALYLADDGQGNLYGTVEIACGSETLHLHLLPMCQFEVSGLDRPLSPGETRELAVRFGREHEIPRGRVAVLLAIEDVNSPDQGLVASIPVLFPTDLRGGVQLSPASVPILSRSGEPAELVIGTDQRVVSVRPSSGWPSWLELDLASDGSTDPSICIVTLTHTEAAPSLFLTDRINGRIMIETADGISSERSVSLTLDQSDRYVPEPLVVVANPSDVDLSLYSSAAGELGAICFRRCGWDSATLAAFGLDQACAFEVSDVGVDLRPGNVYALNDALWLSGRPVLLVPGARSHVPRFAAPH